MGVPATLAQEAADLAPVAEALGPGTGVLGWAWLIPVLTVAAFLLVAGFGRRRWEGGAAAALAGTGAAMVLSLLVAFELFRSPGRLPYVEERTWLAVAGVRFEAALYLDHLTAVMLLAVSVISFLIVLYSVGYMHGERGVRRYYAEMALFITGMLGFVLAGDFLLAFIFWEVMGLCSYLLIGFWYEKPEAASAAKKAFVVTRVGDVFFLLGLVILGTTFGTTNMRDLFHFAGQAAAGSGPFVGQESTLLGVTLLFFGGAVGKSAQFPLHVWLPDAMEGPTTVSALIHAATMVKAGVYLVARAYPLFVLAPLSLEVVAVVGAFTALFAATMALVAYDIKRVLAYSTISQLAYMFLALGVGATGAAGFAGFTAGMFHLTSHAFTKALLFLGAGSVIHAVGTNDLRRMGGLRAAMPVTSLTMLIGALSMAGFPGLSVFWSKDEVLAATLEAGSHASLFTLLFVLGVLTAFLTAFYMFRLWFLAFAGPYRGEGHPHESPRVMTWPLVVLAGFAALWGIAALAMGFGNVVFFDHEHAAGFAEALASPVAWLSALVALAGIALAHALYVRGRPSPGALAGAGIGAALHRVLSQRYYFDHAYNWFAGRAYVAFAAAIDWFDRLVIDGAVNGAARLSLRWSDAGRKVQTGNVQDYAAMILAGVLAVALVAFYALNPGSALHDALVGALGGGA